MAQNIPTPWRALHWSRHTEKAAPHACTLAEWSRVCACLTASQADLSACSAPRDPPSPGSPVPLAIATWLPCPLSHDHHPSFHRIFPHVQS